MENTQTAARTVKTSIQQTFNPIVEKTLPDKLVHNTVAIFQVEPSDDICNELFFYIRKNELDMITDIEMIGKNAKLKGEVAVDLIYPYQFQTETDLTVKIKETAKSIYGLLNMQAEKAKQLTLFNDVVTDYNV